MKIDNKNFELSYRTIKEKVYGERKRTHRRCGAP